MSELLERPARPQVKANLQNAASQSSSYNIWYHKENYGRAERVRAFTRCNVDLDAGHTKAKASSYVCRDFSIGACPRGYECLGYHMLPSKEFSDGLEVGRDCFGRERHGDHRQDRGGIGSFLAPCLALYVGGLSSGTSEKTVRRHFEEWGPVTGCRVVQGKAGPIAFVHYAYRAAAEFAKEAMDCQGLDQNEMLNVRWAEEDPNPVSMKKRKLTAVDQMEEIAAQKRLADEMRYKQREKERALYAAQAVSAAIGTNGEDPANVQQQQAYYDYYYNGGAASTTQKSETDSATIEAWAALTSEQQAEYYRQYYSSTDINAVNETSGADALVEPVHNATVNATTISEPFNDSKTTKSVTTGIVSYGGDTSDEEDGEED